MRRSEKSMTSEMVSQLRGYVARLIEIELELRRLRAEKKFLYDEAKACRFNKSVLYRVVQRKLMQQAKPEYAGLNDEMAAVYEAVLDD